MKHLPLDALGDVEAAEHDPHVAACEQCRQVVEEQRWVRELLASLPTPGAAPPDVVASIDAALRTAAEGDQHAERSSSKPLDQSEPGGTTGATIVPLERPGPSGGGRSPRYVHRGTVPRLLAAAAAAVVVIGGGALVSQQLGGVASDASGAGGAAEMAAGGGSAASKAVTGASVVGASGTKYTRARLSGQVQALLDGLPTDLARPTSGLARPQALQACLKAISAPADPLAVDLATFDGKPAAIVVLPAATGGGREVWVVARSCKPGADGTMYYARLP